MSLDAKSLDTKSPQPLNRLQIAWRAAQDITDGMLVNLGLGMPIAVADYLRPEIDVFIQSENGVIGVGALAAPDRADPDLVDAGSRRITVRPGAAFVDSSASFAMIRGGHIDVAILGAFEVAANGDLANWDMRLPNKGPLVGGAMDLAACARAVWVIMDHVTRKGAPRLLEKCTLPLTAVRCVKRVFTDLAVIEVTLAGMVVREVLAGLAEADLRRQTGAPLTFAPDCRPLTAPPIELPAADRA
ncbi:MAG TPA: 3-oxoacid CoA-transferase subunit B [Xanthobacteraceae bacterium]|nr:3-oxoacid CoA-transferase subunit B [Xanthobacteraceae bacterium]